MSQLELLLIEGEDGEEGDFFCQLGRGQEDWSIHVGDSPSILFLSDRFVLLLVTRLSVWLRCRLSLLPRFMFVCLFVHLFIHSFIHSFFSFQ